MVALPVFFLTHAFDADFNLKYSRSALSFFATETQLMQSYHASPLFQLR